MGDKLGTNYVSIGLAVSVISLFLVISALFLIETNVPTIRQEHNQQIIQLTGNTVKEKINVNYDKNSENNIGVLIKADNLNQAEALLKSKGAKTKRHKIGNVIAVSIPENQIDSLINEDLISQVLPNRVVTAFSINEVEETNAVNFWNNGFTGKGITVAVLDTGLNTGNVVKQKDFTGSETEYDENGHGTKIAEIITAMAPDVKLINAKVLDKDGAGSEASVIAGINYAVENNADVISLSLGGWFDDINSPLVSAVEDAISNGVIVVVASGNCGVQGQCGDFVGVATPGNSPNAITVGSVNGESRVSYSSGKDYGNYMKPDVVAPVSANSISGTSASTPFVSGAAALMIQKYGNNNIKSLIENNAKDLGINGKDIYFGSGKLNLDFLTEVAEEQKIEFAPIIKREASIAKNIKSFSTTDFAGDWHTFLMYRPAWVDGNRIDYYQNHHMKLRMYNRTNGFIFLTGTSGFYAFNGTVIDTYKYNNPGCAVDDIKVINKTLVYAGCLDRIKKFNGAVWVNETLPPHKNTTNPAYGYPTGGFDIKTIEFNKTATLIGFAGGTNLTGQGIILNKTGSGIKWSLVPVTFLPIKDIKFVNKTLAFAVGSTISGKTVTQKIYKWNGAWSEVFTITSSTRGELNEIEIVSPNLAFAVGNNGTMMQWSSGTWSDITSPTTNSLNDISFSSPTLGYAVGAGATVLKYTGTWSNNSNGGSFLNQDFCIVVDNPNSFCGSTSYAEPSVTSNVTFYDVNVLSSANGFLLGAGLGSTMQPGVFRTALAEFRLKPTTPTINVPKLDVEQNSSLTINLKDYSNGNSFTQSGVCSLSGTNNEMLTISASALVGLKTCTVTAWTSDLSLSSSQAVLIEVHPSGPLSDLMIESSDIKISPAGSNTDINVTVHNIGRSTASGVSVKLIESKNNVKLQETTQSFGSIANKTISTKTISFNIQRGSVVTVVVDDTNSINEYSESNNRAEITYKKLDVYFNFAVQPEFEDAIKNYLAEGFVNYNIVNSISDAEAVVNITYNAGNNKKGCNLGTVYYGGKAVNDVHTGLIFSNGKTTTVCGARIEGLVNAIKRLNKEDIAKNKETFFDRSDLGAIAIRDYFNNKVVNSELIKQALNGPMQASDNVVKTNDGVYLRLKRYKPIVSQSFLDYLFNAGAIPNNYLPPVIMAGGLWSDITAWDVAGKEISIGMEDGYLTDSIEYAPRDVWLIELTGGPGTDCDTCNDYSYNDVVNKYWPAAVGGVLKITGKTTAAYVGHSNGGRVALDAMKNYSVIRSTYPISGYLADGVTSYGLPVSNPITTFIGVGVPGAFNSYSPFASIIAKRKDEINNNIQSKGLSHITFADISSLVLFGIQTPGDGTKISFNMWKKYAQLMNSTTDIQPGTATLSKSLIIAGTLFGSHDEIVPVNDVDSIYNKINVTTGSANRKVLMHMFDGHAGMTESNSVKTAIKEFLNDNPLTGKIQNQVSG